MFHLTDFRYSGAGNIFTHDPSLYGIIVNKDKAVRENIQLPGDLHYIFIFIEPVRLNDYEVVGLQCRGRVVQTGDSVLVVVL